MDSNPIICEEKLTTIYIYIYIYIVGLVRLVNGISTTYTLLNTEI